MRTADKFGICTVVQRGARCRRAIVSEGSARKLGRWARCFERVGVRVGGLDGQTVQPGAECADQVRRTARAAVGCRGVIGQNKLFGRAGDGLVDGLLLHEHALGTEGRQRHADAVQRQTIGLGEHGRRAGCLGQHTVVAAQHDQILDLSAAHAVNGAAGHAVERDRNRAYVVLGQDEVE